MNVKTNSYKTSQLWGSRDIVWTESLWLSFTSTKEAMFVNKVTRYNPVKQLFMDFNKNNKEMFK